MTCSTLSYFRSYILRVFRNVLVQRFSNHLYLYPFLYYYYFNSSSARTIFIRLKLVWTCLWSAWTGRYIRQGGTSSLLSAHISEKSFILTAPWIYATILFHFVKTNILFKTKHVFNRNIKNWKYNNLKIYRSCLNFEVDNYGIILNVLNFSDAPHSQHSWTTRHWLILPLQLIYLSNIKYIYRTCLFLNFLLWCIKNVWSESKCQILLLLN